MSRKVKYLLIAAVILVIGGVGIGIYLKNQTNPYVNHSLNLRNVNTKSAREQAAQASQDKQNKRKGVDHDKLAREESAYMKRVHNEGLSDKQLKQKYRVTPQITKHGQAAAKQNIGGTLDMIKNKNYDQQAMADQYFNGQTWGLSDLTGCLNAGMTPDYNSLKLTYYDGYVYKMSMNLNGPNSSDPYAKVTGYYISKTGQMQLKKTTLTSAGNNYVNHQLGQEGYR